MDQGGLSAAPAVDATAAARLVTSAEARDIAYVIADGNIMVEHGRLAGIDESTLAHDLTRIAAVLQDRETNGKIWSEMIPVQANAAEPVERYRLIRKPDTVGLQLTNVSGRRLTISVAFSGTTFGGKTPMTMRPESLARFPMASPPTFGRYEIRLAPHETLTITKPAGSLSYSLQTVDRAVIHESVAQEQVAIWLP